jgi:hypothetical protein
LISATLVLLSTSAHAETAAVMGNYCRAFVTIKVKTDESFMMPSDQDSGICWGAFAAIQSIVNANRDDTSVCAPANTSRLTIIQWFASYVSAHPEVYNQEFLSIALAAELDRRQCR